MSYKYVHVTDVMFCCLLTSAARLFRSAADAITLFCEWIHRYISTASHNSMHNDIAHHGTFYSVVQAVFYILAFRQKEFLEMGKGMYSVNFLTCIYVSAVDFTRH